MEEIVYEFGIFFPLNPDSPIKKYLHHHEKHLLKCIKNQLYSSGFYHLHLIYMKLIYVQIERILNNITPQERRSALIGFAREENQLYTRETEKIKATALSVLNEKTVFRFFRVIIKNDEIIRNASSLVGDRNILFHAGSADKLLESEGKFSTMLEKYISSLKKIVDEEIEFLKQLYKPTLSLFKEGAVTEDDLFKEFGTFSTYELRILAKRDKTVISKQILEIIWPK